MEAAQRLAGLGSWEWLAEADDVTWSAELYRIFGVDPSMPAPKFSDHPDWFSSEGWQSLKTAVERTMSTGEGYLIEATYRRSDGVTGWLELRGEAIQSTEGTRIGLRGTALEITERVKRQDAAVARLAAEAIGRERSAFLKVVSEDIRNALNGVTGSAHMLRRSMAGDAQHERWVSHILSAADQIVALIQRFEAISTTVGRTSSRAVPLPSSSTVELREDLDASLQILLELVPRPLMVYDQTGRVLFLSKMLTVATGYTREDISTRAEWLRLAYDEADAEEISSRLTQAFVARSVVDGGVRRVRMKSGELRLWHVFAAPFQSAQTHDPLLVSVGIDLTHQDAGSQPDFAETATR